MAFSKRDFLIGAGSVLALQQAWDSLTRPMTIPIDNLRRIDKEIAAVRETADIPGITRGFSELADKYHLSRAMMNVLAVHTEMKMSTSLGSAVYLGDGKIALCAHEIDADEFDIAFMPMVSGRRARAKVLTIDKKHDIAIAQITTPGFAERVGLVPVKRQPTNYTEVGQQVVAVGYFDRNLHAVEETPYSFKPELMTTIGPGSCKIESAGKTNVWGGMSGGGVFGADGEFLGILNLRGVSKVAAYHTPASVVWNLLDTINGKPVAEDGKTPEPCRVDRRQLFANLAQTLANQ